MEKVTSKDGTIIAYDKTGNGPVLILVLGALNSRKSGTKLAKLLSARFTVITYDRRGRGNSTDTAPYSPQCEVEDIAALIDAVGEPVYIYGHSSGAALALETAMILPKKIGKLAIYEVPYTIDNNARDAAKEYYKALKKFLADGRKDDAVALFVQSVGVSDKQIQAMMRMPMWKGLVKLAPTLAYRAGCGSHSRLFDHLVCADANGAGNHQSEFARGPQVQHESERRRHLERQLRGRRSAQDAAHIVRGAREEHVRIRSIGNQAARFRRTPAARRWQECAGAQRHPRSDAAG